jgi:hypothetical protein
VLALSAVCIAAARLSRLRPRYRTSQPKCPTCVPCPRPWRRVRQEEAFFGGWSGCRGRHSLAAAAQSRETPLAGAAGAAEQRRRERRLRSDAASLCCRSDRDAGGAAGRPGRPSVLAGLAAGSHHVGTHGGWRRGRTEGRACWRAIFLPTGGLWTGPSCCTISASGSCWCRFRPVQLLGTDWGRF